MFLTPELIESVKKDLDIKQYFIPADKVTANHILYKEFAEKFKYPNLPKIVFYILMNEEYGFSTDTTDGSEIPGDYCEEKESKGNLGRRLKLNPDAPVNKFMTDKNYSTAKERI